MCKTIVQNALNLLNTIAVQSCIRYPIISLLSRGLKIVEAEEILGVGGGSIYLAKTNSNLMILDNKFRLPKPKKVLVDLLLIISFWLEQCPVPSGSKRIIIDYTTRKRVSVDIQRKSTPESYKLFCERNPNSKCCLISFMKYKPFNVKLQTLPTKANLIDLCSHCLIYKQLSEKKKDEKLFKENKEHIKNKCAPFLISEKED